jgi:pimeloyl-ACP methyl ester carboxylesterase
LVQGLVATRHCRRLRSATSEANLEQQLAVLRRRRLPVFILWGREDRVVPLASTEALARFDPDLFAEFMTNVVGAFPPGSLDESQTA